jgi:hypothetical protein
LSVRGRQQRSGRRGGGLLESWSGWTVAAAAAAAAVWRKEDERTNVDCVRRRLLSIRIWDQGTFKFLHGSQRRRRTRRNRKRRRRIQWEKKKKKKKNKKKTKKKEKKKKDDTRESLRNENVFLWPFFLEDSPIDNAAAGWLQPARRAFGERSAVSIGVQS